MYNLRTNKQNKKTNKKVKNKNNNSDNTSMSYSTSTTNPATPSRECLRESIQNSVFNNVYNRNNVESPFKLITVMDKRFERLTEQIGKLIENKLNEYKIDFLHDLDKRFNSLKSELDTLNGRVTQIEAMANEFNSMQKEITNLKDKIRLLENNNVAREVRLNGIPFSENEDLSNIFSSICNTLNIAPPAIKSISRLRNMNNNNDNHYLSKFRKTNRNFNLCLRHIGIDSDSKFYINENLTKNNFQILRAAVRLKKKKLLHNAFTLRGFVYIKRSSNDDILRIDNIEQLSDLFPNSDGIDVAATQHVM